MSTRRRRRNLSSDTSIAELAAVITGGSSAILGLYDTRYNVGVVGGVVSQWDDARGPAGFGPSMVQSNAPSRPAWDAVNKLISSDGAATYIATPLSSLFDISGAITLVYIGAVVSGTGVCALRDGATVPLFKIINTGSITATVFGGAGADLSSSVASGATRRCVIAQKGASANTNLVRVPNVAQQGPGTGSTCAAGNRQFIVGASGIGTEMGVGVWRCVFAINHATSPTEDSAIRDWAIKYHAAVAA